MSYLLRIAICLLGLTSVILQGNEVNNIQDPVKTSLISEDSSIQQGHSFWVAIHIQIDPNWHAYWKNPGDAGIASSIEWNLPDGFKVENLSWPTPKRFQSDSMTGFGYENEILLLTQMTPPETFVSNDSSTSLEGTLHWLVCSDSTCLPGESSMKLIVPITLESPEKDMSHAVTFERARANMPQIYTGKPPLRNRDFIELTIDDALTVDDEIMSADFFPETKKHIDYSTSPLVEIDHNNQNKVIIKELKKLNSLKGVLVLNTAKGRQSYGINAPIISSTPHDETEEITMATPQATHAIAPITDDQSFEFQGGLALALAFAFMGGLLLNLMPCVLPVISFKIMGFIKLAGESRKLIFKHGIAFSLGVLISFWVLAGVLLGLQAYGRSVGWGFQLQEPIFVAILAAFLFLFSLSLFGMFEVGVSVMSAAGKASQSQNRNAFFGSFLSGVFATAVATPCTGPFLGSAVGYAVTLPAYQAMSIFTVLGLGMSSPYLLIAAFPSLLRFLPKPGNWMIAFKELMGFLMLAAVLWLVWVFGAQTSETAIAIFLVGLFVLSFAGWIYGRFGTPVHKKIIRRFATIVAAVIFCVGAYAIVYASTLDGPTTLQSDEISDGWEPFSPERIAELQAEGIPVFVDFTAKWCLICQTNHAVLSSQDVSYNFEMNGVVRMKADWTKKDPIIAAELRKFGRNSVPLYVLYGSDKNDKPLLLPQVLTPQIVIDTLKQLK